MSSGDVVLSKLAVESNRQQQHQQIGSNNSPLNLSSISPSNTSINSMSSHSPPNYYQHHYQTPAQTSMTATTPIMDNNYSPKPVTSSSPIMNAPSNSSSPVLTIDTQQDCSDSAQSATASSYHATCSNCTHMCHSQPKEVRLE